MTADGPETILSARDVTKRYGGATALDGASLTLRRGEVHALLGENGAGKSTLIKILSGSIQPDSGSIILQGQEVQHLSPTSAADLGVSTVFQELSLVPTMTLTQNLFLGRELRRGGRLDKREMDAVTRRALARVGLQIDPKTPASGLSRAHLQLVEIARALERGAPILILDEPTASISAGETRRLFEILRGLRADGVAIVYITHRLKEVRELADRVTVLRDGRNVGTAEAAGMDDGALVQMMTGRSLKEVFPPVERRPDKVRLRMQGVSSDVLKDVSLEVAGGEIVGIAGLVGSGKSEIARAAFGLHHHAQGEIEINGSVVSRLTPRVAMQNGLIYYPADRLREGLVRTTSLEGNVALPAITVGRLARWGLVSRKRRAQVAKDAVERLAIRPADPGRSIMGFSGGNQQKALLARSFARDFEVHLFDEPTVGIDVGAKVEVYRHIKRLSDSGAAVVVVSSDMEEVVGLAHRLYVVREGEVVAHLTGTEVTEERILSAFFGASGKTHEIVGSVGNE
jgi:ribose transport system ATP-binding protein